MANLTKLHAEAKTKGKIEIEDKKIITGKFRLSYPSLFEPKEYQGKKSWSISMIFSKDDDLTELEVAAQNACIEKWGSDTSKWPSKKVKNKAGKLLNKSLIKSPFRDGDLEKPDKPEYENSIFIGASCKKNQPSVCDQKLKPITDETGIKAGDYCRASLIANAFDMEGSVGVSFVLMNVQKLATGEGFGGGRTAAEEFDAVDYEDEEEAEDYEDEE
jgi:hypothetical protein